MKHGETSAGPLFMWRSMQRTLSPTQQRLTEGFRRREADERAKYSEKDEVDLFNSVNFKRLEDLEDSRSEELDDSEDVLVTGFSPGSNSSLMFFIRGKLMSERPS
ncbi:hypothetical protein ACET3Z_007710 [Daucus carota]